MTNHDEQSTPPSFAPAAHGHGHAAAGSDAPKAAGTSTPPSFAPRKSTHAAASSVPSRAGTDDAQPASIPPRRRSQGGDSHPQPARQSAPRAAAPAPRAAAVRGGTVARRPHRHRVRNTVVGILVALVLLAGIGIAGVWHWVDHGLHREDWLTQDSTVPASNSTTWLLLGSDERDGTASSDGTTGERTDTILVLTKPRSGASSLISIPRDSLVQVDDTLLKINAVLQVYGRQELVNQVEEITGHRIDHVVKISFGGLTGIVDALGGVQLCYDADVDDERSELHWTAGCHMADGQTALAFSRMRYSDPKGDFGRAERQQQVISAIAKKALSPSTLLNPGKLRKVGDAALAAVTVDQDTTPMTLVSMLLAFRAASSDKGVTGSLYWTDPGYEVAGVGSSVLLDNERNLELFDRLDDGTQEPGQVGSTAELG